MEKMLKRPSPKDTEEDLIRFQDEYLASIDKKQETSKSAAAVYKNAKGAMKNKRAKDQSNKDEEEQEEHGDPAWFPLSSDKNASSVLGDIVERQFDASKVKLTTLSVNELNSHGFPEPEVLHLPEKEAAKPGRGMSLFAKQMLAKQQKQQASTSKEVVSEAQIEQVREEEKDEDFTGEKEVSSKLLSEVDAENRKRLAQMAPEEIESDRAELNQILPPNLIEFLKNRRAKSKPDIAKKPKGSEPKSALAKPEQEMREKSPETKSEVADLPIKPDPKWLHMDRVETEKLEWTKDVPIQATAMNELRAFETRFGFAGEIAPIPAVALSQAKEEDEFQPPPVELPPSDSALYHHGEEPDRPGYTLAELTELARSSSVQQRILALRTLSAICQQARRGHYSSAGLDKPIIPCLLEAGYAFTIRQALDDSSSEGNAIASLSALCDLMVEPNDEELLDSWASTNMNAKFPYFCDKIVTAPLSDEELSKMDDGTLMSRDVVLCLVFRTNLLARLRYILCDWPLGVDSDKVAQLIIAVLLRIARHSPACASQIASGSSGQRLMARLCRDDMLKQENCFRLLGAIAQSVPTAVCAHFNPNRLNEFIVPHNKSPDSEFRLAAESLQLLTTLCQANVQAAKNVTLALGQRFVETETVLISKASDTNCNLSEHCLAYLSKVFQLFATLSWQSSDDEELYNFDALVYGLLDPIFVLFPGKIVNWLNEERISKPLLLFLASAYHLASSAPSAIERMSVSAKFLKLTELALSKSIGYSVAHSSCSVVLLSFGTDLKQSNESPRSLQYLNALVSSYNSISGISVPSWSLATAIFQFFTAIMANNCQESFGSLIKQSLLSSEITTYLKLIANKRAPVAFANCFFHLNFELGLVCAYLATFKWPATLEIDETSLKTVFTAVLKLLPLMPGLFSNSIWEVLFDGFIFSSRILEMFDKTLANSIQSVRSVYRDALSVLLEGQKFYPFSQSALCKDWLYFPLAAAGITVSLGPEQPSSVENSDIMPAMRHRVVVSVLRFVRFTFHILSQTIFQELTPVTHFVRLSSLYLNDDVFGGAAGELEGVRGLLAECLTALVKSNANSLRFSERVPGLDSTLPDFYIALLEQFKAASYGDIVFGNILLLFAGSTQPLALRRSLWGDHREVLTFLRQLRTEQLLIDMDVLLQPFESDLRMIKLYAEFVFNEIVSQFRNVANVPNNNSVIWIVAINHLNAFLFDSSEHKAGQMLRKSVWQAAAQQAVDASEAQKLKLKDLVFYKYSAPSSSLTAPALPRLYETLPQNRQVFLRSVLGEEPCRSFVLSLMQ